MREWLHLLARENVDPLAESARLRTRSAWRTWTGFPRRALNTLAARRGTGDFSLEVKEAMDGCLACKSCVGQCPIKVDVPSFRSRFLEVYHGRYLRPVKDGLVASLERVLPMAARVPRLVNAFTGSKLARASLQRLGLVSLPELSGIDLSAALKQRGVHVASVDALSALSAQERARSVVVVQDAFTSYYDTRIVLDLCELLQRLGFTPWLAPFKPNGKPQHVLGFLGDFERTAAANADMLDALAAIGLPLVGVDPSMTLAYRAEYVKALGQERAPKVALPQEWLASNIDRLPALRREAGSTWHLLPHCTEKTNAPAATTDWLKVAHRLGVDLQIVAAGCCGMAGLYGHERGNRQTSEAIYRLSWSTIVTDPRYSGRLAATGYSCRSQTCLTDGLHLLHPIQVFLARVKAGETPAQITGVRRSAEVMAQHHEEY